MDLVLTLAAWWGPVLAIIFALAATRAARVRTAWLVITLLLFIVYTFANFVGGQVIPVEAYFGDLSWNWGGKIAAASLTLVLFFVLALTTRSISPQTAGYRLRQAPGSFAPAVIATIILTASAIAMEIYANDGTSLDPERLLFQATMPGVDEEPFFRGLLLAAFAAAVPSKGLNFLGAKFNLGGVLVTLLFALAHSMAVQDGGFAMSWIALAATGYLGFGLLWIRERTGSVIVPILAHNFINFTGSFF